MSLRSLLLELYESEKGAAAPADLVRELDELLDSYPVETDAPWLTELLLAVRDRRPTGAVKVPRSSSADSFLYEAAELLGWDNFHDEGEWSSFDFPRRGIHVFINHEV